MKVFFSDYTDKQFKEWVEDNNVAIFKKID
jgi:hypothetical protein